MGLMDPKAKIAEFSRLDRLFQRYVKRAIRLLGPDGVATIVAREFRHAGYPKHLRRHA
jgi:hypothetical protein